MQVQLNVINQLRRRNTPHATRHTLTRRDLRIFCEREFEELEIKCSDWDSICDLDRKNSNYSRKNVFAALNLHLDEMALKKKFS